MFVTKEILEKHNACATGIRVFDRFYPNGVEIMELLDNKHINAEILHWGFENLNVDAAEVDKYYQRLGIVDSTEVVRSERISGSHFVWASKDITSSKFCQNCNSVNHSTQITDSSNISESDGIYRCDDVKFSKCIIDSKCVDKSYVISDSTEVRGSYGVANSRNMIDSTFTYRSSLCEDVHYSSFMTNCHRCLFCTGLKDAHYHIFNEQVSPELFDQIYEAFAQKTEDESIYLMADNIESKTYYVSKKIMDFRQYFSLITTHFDEWVKGVPGFDPFIMYQITFNKKWLEV